MHPDVDDCVSETLRRALEGRERLREGEPLRPWLLGIARHVALDAVRARQRSARRLAQPTSDDNDESLVERVADSGAPADERLDLARRAARVRAAMDRLPDDHRRALEMFHVEGRAYRDISAELGVPIGTVCTWISRARRAIAVSLEGEPKEAMS
jgi:RNA polymerase sigma-70 factor (ECF subfamily)